MKALSIRQPWAHLIIHHGKDIENRSWHTKLRGRFLVHAAKGMKLLEYNYVVGFLADRGLDIKLPPYKEMLRGGIIGSVELVDCVDFSGSLWYMGQKGFVLRSPQPLPFVPYKGRLQFFGVPLDVWHPLYPNTGSDHAHD